MPTWMQGLESVPIARAAFDDILAFLIIAGIISAVIRNIRRTQVAAEDMKKARQAAAYEASTTYQPGHVQTGTQPQPQAVPAQPTVRESAPTPWGSMQEEKPAAVSVKPAEPYGTSVASRRTEKAIRQKSKLKPAATVPSVELGEGMSSTPSMSATVSHYETTPSKQQAKTPILTANGLNRQTMMQAVAWSEVLGSRGGRRGIRR